MQPSVFFFADHDCVLPVAKVVKSLEASGFEGGKDGSLQVMKGAEHAGVLFSWKWSKEVARAVDRVGEAAEKLREED